MVICVYHFMCHGVFQMALVSHLICADHDSKIRVEATSLSFLAAAAVDIMIRYIPSQLPDVVAQISYHGAYTPEQRGLAKPHSLFVILVYISSTHCISKDNRAALRIV